MRIQAPTVSFDQVTFGTSGLQDGALRTWLEDGLDFRLFDFKADIDRVSLEFLRLNDEPIFGTNLDWTVPLIGDRLDSDGFWQVIETDKQLFQFTKPGVALKPALDLAITAGAQISPPQIGSVESFNFRPIVDLQFPNEVSAGETFSFGVRGVEAPFTFAGQGLSNLEGFIGTRAELNEIGIEEIKFDRGRESATVSRDDLGSDFLWPMYRNSDSSDLSFGVDLGEQIESSIDVGLGPVRLSSAFETGQNFEGTATEAGEIRDRLLQLDASAVDILKYLVPQARLLDGDLSWGVGAGPFEATLDLSYQFFDYILRAGLDLVQEFSFEPEYTFDFNIDGQVFSGGIGDTFEYTPQSNQIPNVSVDMDVSGQFKNALRLDPIFEGQPVLPNIDLTAELQAWIFSREFPRAWDLAESDFGRSLQESLSFTLDPDISFELGVIEEDVSTRMSNIFSLGTTTSQPIPEMTEPGGSETRPTEPPPPAPPPATIVAAPELSLSFASQALHPAETVPLSQIFPQNRWINGDTNAEIVQFAVQDRTSGGGRLLRNGIEQAENTVFVRPVEELDQWSFRAASAADARSRPADMFIDEIGFNIVLDDGRFSPSFAPGEGARVAAWYRNTGDDSADEGGSVPDDDTGTRPAADLRVTITDVDASQFMPGSILTVRFDIENRGDSAALGGETGIYLSSTPDIMRDGELIGTSLRNTLQPGESERGFARVELDDGLIGDVHLGVWANHARNWYVDTSSRIIDTQPISIAPLPDDLPDLTLDRVYISDNRILYGDRLPVEYYVSNVGDAYAPRSDVSFYLSETPVFDPDTDRFLTNNWYGSNRGGVQRGIEAGAADMEYQEVRITETDVRVLTGETGAQNLYLIMVIDEDRMVPEVNRSNNVEAVRFTVAENEDDWIGYADNRVFDLQADTDVLQPGETVSLSARIANAGNIDSAFFAKFTDVFWTNMDTGETFQRGSLYVLDDYGTNYGRSFDVENEITVPDSWPEGEYEVFARVRPDSAEPEELRANNDSNTIALTIGEPVPVLQRAVEAIENLSIDVEEGGERLFGLLPIGDLQAEVSEAAGQTVQGVSQTIGEFGTLHLDAAGTYSYEPFQDNSIARGAMQDDRFDLLLVNGLGGTQTAVLSFSVTGVNTPASITGIASGTVTAGTPETAEVEGQLEVLDPDPGEARFRHIDASARQGQYGDFAFTAELGTWGYRLDNEADAVHTLPGGAELTDSLTVTSLDGTASEIINVTIRGANNPATITGAATGSVLGDAPDQVSASGVLQVQDIDAGEDRFQPVAEAALRGAFGRFEFDPLTGEWRYEADPESDAVAALDEGEEAVDTLEVTSLDGTASESLSITVTGLAAEPESEDLQPDDPVSEPEPEDPQPDDPGTAEPVEDDAVVLSGAITDRANEALSDVGVIFTGGEDGTFETQTGEDGAFTFTLDAGAAGRIDAVRDYSPGDPSITASDALEILRIAVGLDASWGPASAQDFIAADIYRSGGVTASDALDVLRHAVGLETEYAPEWVFVDDDADLSEIDSGNVAYDTGIDLAAIAADTQPSMSGILLGYMGEHA